ncbi:16083_t:CDS:2 [Dentiscutata heterogama]|uniref:16083_t:CDS:1 n=1 Tax=Dentiscutata heterogama TaxID=1316150 RepID=A0ACA9MZG1_9GLOM|nr:16083_t:CDS:2 [Dentiscutata heterogama]
MAYDKDQWLVVAMDQDTTLFDRNIEAEEENFDATTTKRKKFKKLRPSRSDTMWHDGRKICINWNRRNCNNDKKCGRVHACLFCKKIGHQERRCFTNNRSTNSIPLQSIPFTAEKVKILSQISPEKFNGKKDPRKLKISQTRTNSSCEIYPREIEKGHICSLFLEKQLPCDLFQVNPCGLVEKMEQIPNIDPSEFATKYENMSHAIRWINLYEKGCMLAKVDIKDAYQILLVHPVDQVL